MTIVTKRKMLFCEHINRVDNLATTIIAVVDGWQARKGRLRTTWLKNIMDWTGLAINDLYTYYMGHPKWKETTDVR